MMPSGKGRPDYRIPGSWHTQGYEGPCRKEGRELLVEARAWFKAGLARIEASALHRGRIRGRSLSSIVGICPVGEGLVREGGRTRRAGEWISVQNVYAQMIRTTAAWDHDGDGRLVGGKYCQLGTFVKAALLLPYLQRMHMTAVYLLPVVKVSRLFRKGELGCPYAARNFFELDGDLFETLAADEYPTVASQFALFVDSAHRLGMRVILDIAPRSAARDCDWILDHPEWFYWIDCREADRYRAPRLPEVAYLNPVADRLHEIYGHPEVRAHLARFRFAPNLTHPGKWANFVRQARARPPEDLLAETARHFGVITAPAFSDCINDPQPPWTDVTFFRLFMDHPVAAVKHLPDPGKQPPYVLFDTIKSSLFEGRQPNLPLWRELSRIIPFYQRFGIDGVRVDMAHALPARLERMILDAPRRKDPDFCFLAEDLGAENHARARAGGYNLIVGPLWYLEPRMSEGRLDPFLKELPRLKVPVTATAELPDTPRAVVRPGGKWFSEQAAVMNFFLPNAVPMLNSGQELLERQPMNLGLDVGRPGRYALPRRDPQYGRLAFFDPYQLHWTGRGVEAMVERIAEAARLRGRYLRYLVNPRRCYLPRLSAGRKGILAWAFRLEPKKGSLLVLVNADRARGWSGSVLGLETRQAAPLRLLALRDTPVPAWCGPALRCTLGPCDVQVIQA